MARPGGLPRRPVEGGRRRLFRPGWLEECIQENLLAVESVLGGLGGPQVCPRASREASRLARDASEAARSSPKADPDGLEGADGAPKTAHETSEKTSWRLPRSRIHLPSFGGLGGFSRFPRFALGAAKKGRRWRFGPRAGARARLCDGCSAREVFGNSRQLTGGQLRPRVKCCLIL